MKLSRTAIKELTAAYRAVLKHALVASMGLVMIAPAVAAGTADNPRLIESFSNKQSNTAVELIGNDDWAYLAPESVVSNNENVSGGVGGAIYIEKSGGNLTVESGTKFTGNKSIYDGGAIGNYGTLNVNGAVFDGNMAQHTDKTDWRPIGGGAISLGVDSHTTITGTTFTNNESGYNGGAIGTRRTIEKPEDGQNNSLIITDSRFENNRANGTVTDTDNDKLPGGNGGAIANTFNTVEIIGTDFVGNTAAKNGGAIYNTPFYSLKDNAVSSEYGGKIVLSDIKFTKNMADGSGGAIYNNIGTVAVGDGAIFEDNKARTGGAIYNDKGSVTIGDNAVFSGNQSQVGGGAIFNTVKGANLVIGNNATFKNNVVSNTSGNGGGAILINGGTSAEIGNGATFKDNKAAMGGAISALSSLKIGTNAKFSDNEANTKGGALYFNSEVTIGEGAIFKENSAVQQGGAIAYNGMSELSLAKATFEENEASGYKITDHNGIERKQSVGGAIAVIKGSKLEVVDSIFLENESDVAGGAIAQLDGSTASINIRNSYFKENETGAEGGAIQSDAELNISGTRFFGNKTTGTYVDNDNPLETNGGGGAIFMYDESKAVISDSLFSQNSSGTNGGAISTRVVSNISDKSALTVKDSVFRGNSAGGFGGAIYNTVTSNLADVTFSGNNAKKQGGAIYNDKFATVNLTGTNVFSGNKGMSEALQPALVGNDIHNLGQLNISAGETTFASGVSGTGTLTVADGAIMNIGTATIDQGTININGIVTASMVDSKTSYGKFIADNYSIGENGTLKLNVGAVGTYQIFNKNVADMNINAGAAYVATQNTDGTVLIETKALEDLAADTGLSVKAAGVVAGLANSADRSLSMLSLRVQNALDAGRVEYVEQEAGKLNPEEKPVAHSVASSVQNQIMNTLTNRMAALGAVGRNGGDVNAEYGFWAHGLINKSKYGSQFHGYTRGTAIGLDALINRAFTIGAGYAYAATDMHSHDRTTDIESNTFFVYGQYKPAKGYVNAALNYTKSEYEEHLSMFDLNFQSDHDVITYGGQVMTGYDFSVGLTPEVGLRYLHMSQDDYSNGLATVKGTDSDFVTGTAGMKYSFLIQDTGRAKWRPELRAAATYDFVSDDTAVTVTMPGAAPYIVDGDRLSRFGGEFGLGLSIECPGLTLTLSYDLDLHKDYTSQTGMAKLKLMF